MTTDVPATAPARLDTAPTIPEELLSLPLHIIILHS
jgi:hypothetical protein